MERDNALVKEPYFNKINYYTRVYIRMIRLNECEQNIHFRLWVNIQAK